MFVVMNRMTVPDEYRKKFEEVFSERAGAVDTRTGFIRAEILKPKTGNDYVVMTEWESEKDFDGWVGSPEYIEGHRRIGEFRDENGNSALKSKIEKYEVFAC